MKRWIALLLSLLFVCSCAPVSFAAYVPAAFERVKETCSFGAYQRVFIVGVDGAGRFFQDADTPNFDRIFAEGAVKYNGRAEVYTDSGPNWGSILTGASNLRTKYTNGNVSPEGESWANGYHMRKYPTIFRAVRKAFPEAELASFSNYITINYGILEDDLNITKVYNSSDEKLTEEICAYFDAGNQPTLFFSHFGSVDDVGHSLGSASKEYMDQIHIVDGYIGAVYDALERNGLLEDALFLVVDDHGHKPEGGHGRFSMDESLITLAVRGKTVVSGGTLDLDTRNRDVAAIALYALGVRKPITMTARIPGNLFQNVPGETRPIYRDVLDALISFVFWFYTLSTANEP